MKTISKNILLSIFIFSLCQCSDKKNSKNDVGKIINVKQENSDRYIVSYTSLKIHGKNKVQFETYLNDLCALIKKQQGCITSQWFTNPNDESNYVFYIEFDDEKNFVEYRKNPEILNLIKSTTATMLIDPPIFRYYRSELLKEGK